MLRASEKRLIRKIIFGKIGIVVLVIIFALFAKGTWGVYQKAQFAKEKRVHAEERLSVLQEQEVTLTQELKHLNTPRGLEEEMRKKFDVGQEGEQLIVLVDAPAPEIDILIVDTGVWGRIVEFLGFK